MSLLCYNYYGDIMIKIKRVLSFFVIVLVIIAIGFNFDKIYAKIDDYINQKPEIVVKPGNEYTKNRDYLFVKHTDNFEPHNFEDLKNIFYTILDKGWNEFTFYCPDDYTQCLDDITKISNDDTLLSSINNYVHPYNSYSSIKTLYDDTGEINITINHLYTDEEIKNNEMKMDSIMNSILNDNMDIYTKIKTFHDYIINNTKYDLERSLNGDSQYNSAKMNGVLFEGYGICSGYTDTMAVFLNKLGLNNFKIASETHIWNAVMFDNNWLHLDLTWNDPVSASGKDILSHSFFLISDNELKVLEIDTKDHVYDNQYYLYFS